MGAERLVNKEGIFQKVLLLLQLVGNAFYRKFRTIKRMIALISTVEIHSMKV